MKPVPGSVPTSFDPASPIMGREPAPPQSEQLRSLHEEESGSGSPRETRRRFGDKASHRHAGDTGMHVRRAASSPRFFAGGATWDDARDGSFIEKPVLIDDNEDRWAITDLLRWQAACGPSRPERPFVPPAANAFQAPRRAFSLGLSLCRQKPDRRESQAWRKARSRATGCGCSARPSDARGVPRATRRAPVTGRQADGVGVAARDLRYDRVVDHPEAVDAYHG